VKITRNMSSKFYPGFIPIFGYMVSGVRIQLPGASVLKPDTCSFLKAYAANLLEVGTKIRSKFMSI